MTWANCSGAVGPSAALREPPLSRYGYRATTHSEKFLGRGGLEIKGICMKGIVYGIVLVYLLELVSLHDLYHQNLIGLSS